MQQARQTDFAVFHQGFTKDNKRSTFVIRSTDFENSWQIQDRHSAGPQTLVWAGLAGLPGLPPKTKVVLL